jgi:hypothetical protein
LQEIAVILSKTGKFNRANLIIHQIESVFYGFIQTGLNSAEAGRFGDGLGIVGLPAAPSRGFLYSRSHRQLDLRQQLDDLWELLDQVGMDGFQSSGV